jgi:hypothetical protein
VRRREDFVGRAGFHEPAEKHDQDAVAEVPHDAQIVAEEKVREVKRLAQVHEQIEQPGPDRHVERRDRIVADEELGFDGERAGDADASPRPAAEAVRVCAQRLAG